MDKIEVLSIFKFSNGHYDMGNDSNLWTGADEWIKEFSISLWRMLETLAYGNARLSGIASVIVHSFMRDRKVFGYFIKSSIILLIVLMIGANF